MLRLRKELDRCDRERCGLLTAMEW
jgi:hypothetical protein